MSNKLTSRKFWLAVGGSATGIGTLIAGITTADETATLVLSIVGVCLTAISIVAYNFAEAFVDGKAAAQIKTEVNVIADTPNTVDKLITDASVKLPDMDEIKIGGTA